MMNKIKFGLQMHAVREDFLENPKSTLAKVKEMGYDGVEFNYSALTLEAHEYKSILDDCGLECFGTLVDWDNLKKEKLPGVIEYHKILGTDKLIVGSVPGDVLNMSEDSPQKAVQYLGELYNTLSSIGFVTGYHNHDSDFEITFGGKSFFEYVMDNTPNEFIMVLDTGNAVAGGGSPVDLLRKYPKRTPIMHIKGYGQTNKYTTPVWEADFDFEEIIKSALLTGNLRYLDIEFGARGGYEPMERAGTSVEWLKKTVKKIGGR